MSPVRVKLGDFGISKRIHPEATTTFHTQVSTQIYGAPEVLGLVSNNETSVYTNSVDIWSLGCVIYELLAGTRLFASATQVSCYILGIWPFPEDKLKALPIPTDDTGISFLKSMVSIQPRIALLRQMHWAMHGSWTLKATTKIVETTNTKQHKVGRRAVGAGRVKAN